MKRLRLHIVVISAALLSASAVDAQVGPLLTTEWSQRAPYNNLCPTDPSTGENTLAGCVAIAMAQVINYWQFPVHGIGKNSYRWVNSKGTTKTLSANFGTTYYRWEDMETPISVAQLVYNCGVSVNMDYSSSFSGSSEYYAKNALEVYWGYSDDIMLRARNSYSDEDWAALLKDQLDKGWPIIYSSGSHTFVVDGYNSKGEFHSNQGYGWGGYWETVEQLGNKTSSSAIINIHPDYSSKANITEPTFVVYQNDGKSDVYPSTAIDAMDLTSQNLTVTQKDETKKVVALDKLSYVLQHLPIEK